MKNLKNQTKNKETGITLIALIISVIILVILASISISEMTGNGLISQTLRAKEQAEIQEEVETIQTAVVRAKGKNKYGKLTQYELQETLDLNMGKNKANVIADGNGLVVKIDELYYLIDSKGNVSNPQKLVQDEYAGDLTKGRKV